MICLPTSVEPVKHTLRTSGWVTNRSPTTDPLPGMTVSTPSGSPASTRQLTDPDRGERRDLGGLEHDGVAGRQRRREPPAGDGHREVPGHDDADHAERLVEGDVDATGDRDLLAEEALGCGGVVVQAVADVARLPAGVADRVAGVGHLELGQLLDVRVDDGGERAQQPGPFRRAPRRARRRTPPARGRSRRRSPRRSAEPTSAICWPVTGLIDCGRRAHQLTSSRRCRASSQSVTAASKAVELDVGHVDVVVHDLLTQGRAGDLGGRERLARGPQGVRHVRLVRVVGVADQLVLELELVLDAVQAAGQHRGQRQVGVHVAAGQAVLHPAPTVRDRPGGRRRCGCRCPTRPRSARTRRRRTACRS